MHIDSEGFNLMAEADRTLQRHQNLISAHSRLKWQSRATAKRTCSLRTPRDGSRRLDYGRKLDLRKRRPATR